MSICLLCLGKTRDKYLQVGVDEYIKRLSAYHKVEVLVLPDISLKNCNNIEIVKTKEAEIIKKHLPTNHYKIMLDERGKQFSSVDFSRVIAPRAKLAFVIGGVYGLDKSILAVADMVLSFSPMTFTHQMIRLLLFEQIYRAYTIINGKKYHY